VRGGAGHASGHAHADRAAAVQGKDAVRFIEKLVVGDIGGLPNGSGTLTLMTNEKGGIIDDSVVTKVSDDKLYMVLNAGCRDKDLEHLNDQLKAFDGECKMRVHDERSLIAFQGPKAVEVLQAEAPQLDLSKLYFGNVAEGVNIAGVGDCWVMRTGCAAVHARTLRHRLCRGCGSVALATVCMPAS
jgi:aminomethyltransferase